MLRRPVDNPFVPGSDHVPAVWAGRAEEIADWHAVLRPRRLAGEYERGRAVLGEPGIGKSVLVNRLADEAASAGDLIVPAVRVPRGADPLALLAGALRDAVESEDPGSAIAARATGLLERIASISLFVKVDVSARSERGHPHVELQRLLVELGQLARDDGRAVILRIDEVQNVTDRAELSQLLVALGDALGHLDAVSDAAGNVHQKVLPLAVYLTGLPEFGDRATSVAGATFARRFLPVRLTHLTDAEIRLALSPFTNGGWLVVADEGPVAVVMTADAVDAMVKACLGDPFLFQLAGKAAWDASQGVSITSEDVRTGWQRVRREARAHVERSIERLPPLERAFLDALVCLDADDRSLSRVAEAIGRRSAELATTGRRLEERGLIDRGRPYTFVARTVEAYLDGTWS